MTKTAYATIVEELKLEKCLEVGVEYMNVLTVDVEEWYHAEPSISEEVYRNINSKQFVVNNTRILLRIFQKYHTHATFFILGEIAVKYPGLIKEIKNHGHEIATHGFSHKSIPELGKKRFEKEIIRSTTLLENLTGEPVVGHRAPLFSITPWAINILEKLGFTYDSSVFPTPFAPNGIRNAPTNPYHPDYHNLRINNSYRQFTEFPLLTFKLPFVNLPIAGGFYLRTLPLQLIIRGLEEAKKRQHTVNVIYLHPHDVDPHPPKLNNSFLASRWRYYNSEKTTNKIEVLLNLFAFKSIKEVLYECAK